jgi:hypothetical protein
MPIKTNKQQDPDLGQRYGSADPDPYQNFMDPQHCLSKKFLLQRRP